MIDETLPLDQVPRYVHPTTAAPWFACPGCASHHVRVRRLQTNTFGAIWTVTPRSESDAAVDGSDRGLRLEGGCSNNQEVRLDWLECGACATAFRADGRPLEPERAPNGWHVVEDDQALLVIGVRLLEAMDPETNRLLEPLRLRPVGASVYVALAEFVLLEGFWLDEAASDGTTGVHIHPRNYAAGKPSWVTASYGDEEQWPDESLIRDGATRLAYDYIGESLPTA